MDPQALADMEKIARQKAIIRKLESSDGQNMAHEMLSSGPNAGQTAGGAYGIVPNSLKDFANQSMKRNIGVDPDILVEMDRPHKKVTESLNNNRELDEKAAEMAIRLLNMKYGGDEGKTAYAWRTGHNQKEERVAQGAEEHPYVQAYKKEMSNRSPATDSPKKSAQSEMPSPEFFKRMRAILGSN